MEDLITLVAETLQTTAIGARVPVETSRQVWARIRSVSRAEWIEAGQAGLQPAFEVITPRINYGGEKIVIYNNRRYSVYRTYAAENSDDIELYIEEKAGV